jgi:signal transduction protein with GAF and PtsI domain
MKKKAVRRIFLQEFKAISRAISTYEDLNVLTKHIVESITRAFKITGCSIMLFDERENQLFHVSSYGISDAYLDKGPVFADDKYSAFSKGKPVFIESMQKDPRVQYPEAAAKEGISSMLSVPIKSRNALVGIIRFYNSEPWELHEEDLDSFCLIAEHLGLAIETSGLKNFFEKVKVALESIPLRMLRGL